MLEKRKMKAGIRWFFWFGALAITMFLCHVSRGLYEYSTYSLALAPGSGRPPSITKMFLYAAHVMPPPSLEACIARLRYIEGAKQQWVMEHNVSGSNDVAVTWQDIAPYLREAPLWCPDGGRYILGKVSEPPKCSIKSHALP